MYKQFNIQVLGNGAVMVSFGDLDYGRSTGKLVAYEVPGKAKEWLLAQVSEAFDAAMVQKSA